MDKAEDERKICFWLTGDKFWFLLELESLDTELGTIFVFNEIAQSNYFSNHKLQGMM